MGIERERNLLKIYEIFFKFFIITLGDETNSTIIYNNKNNTLI